LTDSGTAIYSFRIAKVIFRFMENQFPILKEDQMNQQEPSLVSPAEAAAPIAQEFYFPLGGGTDPDFNIPADSDRPGFPGWLRALPVFGRRRSA
jgi:hypothetical protein